MIDRGAFYPAVRGSLFGGVLTRAQVVGLDAILDRFETTMAGADRRFLAYMLATAHHETGRRMQPLRETFADSDAVAIARLDAAFAAGRLPSVSRPYWRRDGEGKSWLGRGFVQLTHRDNYARLSEATGIDLIAAPERAMDLDVAVDILFCGMRDGLFTGKKLAGYFSGVREDWSGARRIINGLDRAALVGGYGRLYWAAIR